VKRQTLKEALAKVLKPVCPRLPAGRPACHQAGRLEFYPKINRGFFVTIIV